MFEDFAGVGSMRLLLVRAEGGMGSKGGMWRLSAVVAGLGLAGLALLNRRLEEAGDPARPLGGEEGRYEWAGRGGSPHGGGRLAYHVAGDEGAPPVLLVHGIYAGASSYEFRKNLAPLAGDFRVYALDLLGSGRSDKPDRPYEPEDVTAQVEDFARDVVIGGSRRRAHLVASSLSAALVVPALVRNPRLWGKAVLVVPTGFGSLDRPSGRLGDAVYGLFRLPILGDALYHALVSRAGLRYYLGRMAYHDPKLVTEDLVEDYHGTAHGRGAKHLPAAFVAGKLNLGVAGLFPRVPQKVLVAWGEEAETVPLEKAQRLVAANVRAEVRIFRDAALLPHDERAETFNEEVRAFLSVK